MGGENRSAPDAEDDAFGVMFLRITDDGMRDLAVEDYAVGDFA
jgi:hypothetical protein